MNEIYKEQLFEFMCEDQLSNLKKCLILDDSLNSVIDFLVNKWPQECQIVQKICLSDIRSAKIKAQTLFFIMRPDYDSVYKMRELRGYYNCDKDNIFVLFVPRRTRECDKLLKDVDFLND